MNLLKTYKRFLINFNMHIAYVIMYIFTYVKGYVQRISKISTYYLKNFITPIKNKRVKLTLK